MPSCLEARAWPDQFVSAFLLLPNSRAAAEGIFLLNAHATTKRQTRRGVGLENWSDALYCYQSIDRYLRPMDLSSSERVNEFETGGVRV